jgi:large subunit ribosomal protein L10e
MGLRPAVCYRDPKKQAYTRTAKKVMKKAYIRGVPGAKIHIYNMGDLHGNYDTEVALVCQGNIQLRHNALEAMRVACNQVLSRTFKGQYYFKIRVYPHHVMRENPLASGAGADRFQTGMAKAFGKPIGRAARVKPGQKVASVYVTKEKIPVTKKALKRAMMKLSGKYKMQITENPKMPK